MDVEPQTLQPTIISTGLTKSERYLHRLAKRSFLSLWSYPNIFREPAKELCDLLVVFQDNILILSDKNCAFPNTGNLGVAWCRWFKKAVFKSAEQVWGAERWLRSFPKKLFLDTACTKPFPIELPSLDKAKFHRIVVAHGASTRCKETLGGSGSLMITPRIVGSSHFMDPNLAEPFAVGQLDPSRGFVHIFDDATLDIVMGTLDTTADFVAYLNKKQAFIKNGRLGFAAGEEELLAHYLKHLNGQDEHDFIVPAGCAQIVLLEGLWDEFRIHPQRKAQLAANEPSYCWDALIEKFGHHVLKGTAGPPYAGFNDHEKAIAMLACENRTSRRALIKQLFNLIGMTPSNQRGVRVLLPSRPQGPCYIFLLLPCPENVSEEDYRDGRRKLLRGYCMVVKRNNPAAAGVVGLATEPGTANMRSEDLMYLDSKDWTKECEVEAEEWHRDFNLLTKTTARRVFTEQEYPRPSVKKMHETRKARSARNSKCRCGSGVKFKRCCGRPGRGN